MNVRRVRGIRAALRASRSVHHFENFTVYLDGEPTETSIRKIEQIAAINYNTEIGENVKPLESMAIGRSDEEETVKIEKNNVCIITECVYCT